MRSCFWTYQFLLSMPTKKPPWRWADTAWELDPDSQPALGWGRLPVTRRAALRPRTQKRKTSVIATFQGSHPHCLKHESLASKPTGFPRKTHECCVHTLFKTGATEASVELNSGNRKPSSSPHTSLFFHSPGSDLPNNDQTHFSQCPTPTVLEQNS